MVVALGRHGAALGDGDVLGDLGQAVALASVRPSSPSPSARISARWTIEVGVAADRRGEVGVAAQVEAEVADVLVA